MSEVQKSTPADSYTSWVKITQLFLPSGQNQMNGMCSTPCAFMEKARSISRTWSTVRSMGHFGKTLLFRLFNQNRCKYLRPDGSRPTTA